MASGASAAWGKFSPLYNTSFYMGTRQRWRQRLSARWKTPCRCISDRMRQGCWLTSMKGPSHLHMWA